MAAAALKPVKPDEPSPAADTAPPPPAQSGWNAYEIWRTRVLAQEPSVYKKSGGNS